MRNKKAERGVGLAALVVAFVLAVYFVAVAIRRRSIVSALLAVAAAMSGLGVTCVLLSELVAPDSDGTKAVCRRAEDTDELFEGEEAVVAARRIDAELGII
ncbi:MAG: hypothetical protein E7639_02530 [Ruminococcaceae bacterium]|nr:hypothetical protein [Oscillospiraceae bacterium]